MTTTVALRLFEDPVSAAEAMTRSKGDHTIAPIPWRGRFYLKRLGLPNIEPRYLCTDGRWRKWDNVPELAAIG